MPIPLYIYSIGLSLVVGIINYRWLSPFALRAFIPFLILTLATELIAVYSKYVLDIPNGVLYNVYVFIQVIFCSLFFRSLAMPGRYRTIINAGIVIYVIASVYIYASSASVADFNTWVFLLGGFLVVLSAIFFLFNYFSMDNRDKEEVMEPVIWIAIGLIAYFAVLSITVSLIKYILYYDLEIGGVKLHNIIPRMLSLIMYLCFAYSFHRCRKTNLK